MCCKFFLVSPFQRTSNIMGAKSSPHGYYTLIQIPPITLTFTFGIGSTMPSTYCQMMPNIAYASSAIGSSAFSMSQQQGLRASRMYTNWQSNVSVPSGTITLDYLSGQGSQSFSYSHLKALTAAPHALSKWFFYPSRLNLPNCPSGVTPTCGANMITRFPPTGMCEVKASQPIFPTNGIPPKPPMQKLLPIILARRLFKLFGQWLISSGQTLHANSVFLFVLPSLSRVKLMRLLISAA